MSLSWTTDFVGGWFKVKKSKTVILLVYTTHLNLSKWDFILVFTNLCTYIDVILIIPYVNTYFLVDQLLYIFQCSLKFIFLKKPFLNFQWKSSYSVTILHYTVYFLLIVPPSCIYIYIYIGCDYLFNISLQWFSKFVRRTAFYSTYFLMLIIF